MLDPASTPLTPQAFQILLSLADGRDLHGYAILQDITERTGGEMRLTASTLYAAIKRMVDAGLLVEVDAPAETGGAPRRCYRITRTGRRVAQADAERLSRAVAMARDKRLLPRKA
jgi:DNA-binding PadR family transcriptional regulator